MTWADSIQRARAVERHQEALAHDVRYPGGMQEADFTDALHPRDRRGQFRTVGLAAAPHMAVRGVKVSHARHGVGGEIMHVGDRLPGGHRRMVVRWDGKSAGGRDINSSVSSEHLRVEVSGSGPRSGPKSLWEVPSTPGGIGGTRKLPADEAAALRARSDAIKARHRAEDAAGKPPSHQGVGAHRAVPVAGDGATHRASGSKSLGGGKRLDFQANWNASGSAADPGGGWFQGSARVRNADGSYGPLHTGRGASAVEASVDAQRSALRGEEPGGGNLTRGSADHYAAQASIHRGHEASLKRAGSHAKARAHAELATNYERRAAELRKAEAGRHLDRIVADREKAQAGAPEPDIPDVVGRVQEPGVLASGDRLSPAELRRRAADRAAPPSISQRDRPESNHQEAERIRTRIRAVEAAMANNRAAGKPTGKNYQDLHRLTRQLKALGGTP